MPGNCFGNQHACRPVPLFANQGCAPLECWERQKPHTAPAPCAEARLRSGPAGAGQPRRRFGQAMAGRGAMDTHWAGYSSYNGALRPPLPGARLASPRPVRSQPERCALHMQATIRKAVAAGGCRGGHLRPAASISGATRCASGAMPHGATLESKRFSGADGRRTPPARPPLRLPRRCR